ncbi:MAG: universal stress protein [Leptothrix sp. (in: b-proteobacteria)]
MKILLAVDGSAPALAAVRHALALVDDGLAASFVLVNVQAPPSLYEVVVAHDADVIDQVRAAAGADLLLSAQAMLAAAGVEHEVEVAGGEAARTLVDLIENHRCDAVFVGARGLGQPEASGIGSVTEDLLLHSPVPVTVVRHTASTEGVDDALDDLEA